MIKPRPALFKWRHFEPRSLFVRSVGICGSRLTGSQADEFDMVAYRSLRYSIREMLRNERYRGVQVWNRTEKQRNPETGRKISKQRPESDWVRIDVPEWRIVPEELWNAVQTRIALIKERLGVSRYGGITRTAESRNYLFSGLLICGVCGFRLVIVSGRGRRGYVKYGCPNHRYRGVCSNRLSMRQDRLEAQLLAAIENRVLTPELIDYTVHLYRPSGAHCRDGV
jgi:site-specific DNA recombinase